jgi:hypothetical protein
MPRSALTPDSPSYVIDVSRPVAPRRWTAMVMAPVELLAVAWTAPLVILLLMLPIGIAVALAVWVARSIL